MKKILFINFSLDIGGIETLILEICRRLDRSKYEPAVCSFFPEGRLAAEFQAMDVPVYTVPKGPGLDLSLTFRLARFMRRMKIDIAHTHNHSVWLYGGLAARMARASLVHTEHTSPDYSPERWAWIERGLSRLTDQATAVSKSVRDYMVDVEGISSRKVRVIHNGVKTRVYEISVDRDAKRRELGVRPEEFAFIKVARFFPNKDHQTLVRAFALARKTTPQAKLLLAGDGPERAACESLARELGLGDSISFLGNRRDIPEILKAVDCFAMSSIKEGFPISILEAMASGLPVVATDVDGNAEAVLDGETGRIVPARSPEKLAAAMAELSADPAKARAYGEKGKERVGTNFTFEKMIQSYYDIYDAIAAKRPTWRNGNSEGK